jgi:4-nitrophenyl phosphatase
MRRYPLYILDLDGTLYRGNELLPGVPETLSELRTGGSQIRFLTNNSSQTPEAQAAKLTAMGIQADPFEILTSGVGVALYLLEQDRNKAFVVGEPGLVEVLQGIGIKVVQEGAEAVVVGICKSFSYDLLNQAMQKIHGGALFIATNTDGTYPLEGDRLVPGAGSMVAAVQACTGVEPTVIGKPSTYLLNFIFEDTGIEPEDTLVVGDRFETDIVGGQLARCDTLLMLTGVTAEAPPGQLSAKSIIALLG